MREPPAVTRMRRKYRIVAPELGERRRLQWAAAEAREVGYGGVSVVARATGLARSTIHAGWRDLRASRRHRVKAAERIRRPGGGRRALTTTDPALLTALLALIEPTTRGDPESPLRWTCKSPAQLADELTRQRHPVSPRTVATLLKDAGYSLPANRKTPPLPIGPPVSVLCGRDHAGSSPPAAGDLGRYEEEGGGRRF